MTPERWAQIEELFHRAAECKPGRRISLLDEACRSDPELRRQVDALLSSDRSASDHVQTAVRESLKTFAFPLAGDVISHYRILEGLGGGGMGLVYRAEDLKLGRRVAIKFLPEESAQDTAALARFEREARSASALEHPNICPIYEFGEHQGQPFLVMQLLEGQTLRELISTACSGKTPLPIDKLLDLAIQIADGLDAAHKKGIIHRDIKPANIFITAEGQAKILDFGLAKLARSAAESVEEAESDSWRGDLKEKTPDPAPLKVADPSFSRTGTAMGTAGYMSPEQVRGEKLDARTDLFSLGLVLYEMATGRRAFASDTEPLMQEAILKQLPTPVRQLNPKVPAKLEKIMHRALEKDREARYGSAAEMRFALGTLKRAVESSHLARWAGLAAVVAALAITGVIFWIAKHPLLSTATLPDLKLRQLTVNSSENPVKGGAISPDGKNLAYTDGKGMHIKPIGSDEAQSVPPPEGLKNSDVTWEMGPWFPDSNRFLVDSHPASESASEWSSQTSSIWIVSVVGGSPRKLRDHALAWSVSPDGSMISFGTNNGKLGERGIWLMDQNGEQARQLYDAGPGGVICCLYFFPNGQRVSYVSTNDSGDTVVARDLKGGPITTLLPPSEMKKVGDFTWLPDGRLIYSDLCGWFQALPDRPCDYWMMRLDTRSGNVIEKPTRLTNWVGFWMNSPSATADGKHVAFLQSSSLGVSYMADLEAGGTRLVNSRRFTLEEGGEDAIDDWTADSKAVIVVANRGDHYSLRKQLLNLDAQETIVSSAPGLIEEASVSPDGKWVIAQVRQLPEGVKLMRVPITGGSTELMFTVREGTSFSCARPPADLCALAEQRDDHKQMIIASLDPVKGRGRELARFDLSPDDDLTAGLLQCVVSPDGTRLAAAQGPEGPIQILSLLSGRRQILRTKDLGKIGPFGWAANGKGLIVPKITNSAGEIIYLDLQGNAKVLWKCSSDACFAGSSPDGRHLAVYERKVSANMWMMENF